MCKAERKTATGLVIPVNDSLEEEISVIKEHLLNAGIAEAELEWLVAVLKRPDCFGDPSDTAVFQEKFHYVEHVLPGIVEALGEPDGTDTDQQARLALLFSYLLGFGPCYSDVVTPHVKYEDSETPSDLPGWITDFQAHADLRSERPLLRKLHEVQKRTEQKNASFQFEALIPLLFPKGMPLSPIVDLERLDPTPLRSYGGNDFKNLEQLEFWLIWRFRDDTHRRKTVTLTSLLKPFSELPDAVLPDKIFGLLNAIGYAMDMASATLPFNERLDSLNDGWRAVAAELIPFFELLDKKHPETHKERSPLLKAWWHLSTRIFGWSMGGRDSELSAPLRDRLVESAARHIGILRSILRDTPELFEDPAVSDFYAKAFYVLLVFAPPWKRLKSLLLAFTEMKAQAVAAHLGFWNEPNAEPPPHPYNQVPLWIGQSMYPQNLQDELERDPSLQGLREEFAKFCLGRLRTKTRRKGSDYTNADFVEPRREWRWCYVQALSALKVNPGGRAHKTLFWLLNNDPDETVRKLAQKAHRQIRHLDRNRPNLDEGASPRRPLFEAFWWLRQAHLITLGVSIDSAGAMRTRRKELHRTREKDDRHR